MTRRTVAILLFDDVEVLDFAGPFEVFSVADQQSGGEAFDVVTVAADDRPIRAVGGLEVVPARTLAEVSDPDVLVIPGGDGSRQAMGRSAVLEWARAGAAGGEVVMSVCSGVRILARAGLLSGLRATTHHEVLDDLRRLAPDAEVDPSRRFIDTGRIVTTGGISAGIDGSLHLVARLRGEELARRTAAYMEYRWDPEDGSGRAPQRQARQEGENPSSGSRA